MRSGPSPKLHSYLATVPSLSDEAEASKLVACPRVAEPAVNAAVGVWLGVIAIQYGWSTEIAPPAGRGDVDRSH